ncbi:unnamed protein product [Periconia digitata]|uniref:Uncharacterized protein n=1 Tax=Periconia digitata TaxID=1303443 RepID=A0A9W4XKF4_9PLEO|nr:unnamed protein product [Periconia digitata]
MVHDKNKVQLKINPEPFKPSHLSIPPSPFSPQTPLTNTINRPSTRRTKTYRRPATETPPPPLQWLWQCHQCHRSYSLGVTRRCLEDGHHFCAGTTTVKTWRKPLRARKFKRHRACASEFDYQGWKNWGRWRRSGRKDSIYDDDEDSSSSSSSTSSASPYSSSSASSGSEDAQSQGSQALQEKDCWNACDYPSECRWGKRFGVHTPTSATFPTFEIVSASSVSNAPPTSDPSPAAVTTTTATTKAVEGVLNPENYQPDLGKKPLKTDLWDALVASATRRKSVPPSSPLASVAEEPGVNDPSVVEKDRDGDVVMSCSEEQASSSQAFSPPATSALASLKGVFRRSSKIYSKSVRRGTEVKDAGLVDELTPLERVKSRDSGYHSNQDLF